MTITSSDIKMLIESAKASRLNSYSPYSHFSVGAALLTKKGNVYTGCNIENASFSPTVCAERVAVFKAVSEGETGFSAIAVVGAERSFDGNKPCPPCGVCRQVLREFCSPSEFLIILSDGDNYKTYKLEELLPQSFGPEFVGE